MKRLFSKYKTDLLALFWIFACAFVGLALLSYSPLDPSINALVKGHAAKNLCGFAGSFLADFLLQVFGLPAWVLVASSLNQARLLRVRHKSRPAEMLPLWLDFGVLLVLACLAALHFGELRLYHGSIRPGGWVGAQISGTLVRMLNPVGLGLVLWSLAIAACGFYLDFAQSMNLNFIRRAWVSLKAAFKFRPRVVPVTRQAPLKTTPLPNQFFKIAQEAPPAPPREESDLKVPITGFLHERTDAEPRKSIHVAKALRRVENWTLPKLSLLEDPPQTRTRLDEREIKNKARLLAEKLAQFSIRGEVVGIKPGPAVTMFEFKPAADVKISKITDLADDLSLALSSESVRIIAPIPGRDVVGIETSNSQRESVFVKEIIAQDSFWHEDTKLPVALGRKADGEPKIVDLRKMPHVLVAGSTGSGKSVFVVSMITGLLFRHSPKTLKLILVDPKQVDLAAFNEIPHLIMPPIREAKKAVGALRWAIREMEKRYRSMSKFGARGLESYNEMMEKLDAEKLKQHQEVNSAFEGSFHPESYYFQALPYIVIVVEEFGDLMVVDKINVEQAVVRLAQMARACGIHLVLAMQSPRRDVVTGLIKTNIPGRISFKVASKMDSRIILDESGAERLLARGDMLYLAPGVSKPERHHGPYLSENEIAQVVNAWRSQGDPIYDAVAMKAIEGSGGGFDLDGGGAEAGAENDGFEDGEIRDDRYDEVVAWVAAQKEVSASLLQRKFRLGYPRAARMIEIFESEGVVGPANGSKPRQVLIKDFAFPERG